MQLFKRKSFSWLNLPHVIRVSPFFILIFTFFFLNTFHESYPDEFDNISGGWLILHGKLIYKSFFTHHGPFPYFLSAFINVFSGQSFVLFRIFYAFVLFSYLIFVYWYFQKSIGYLKTKFLLFFLVFLGLMGTYYWSEMLLADNIAAFTLAPVYLLLILKAFYEEKLSTHDLVFISVLSAVGLYSSLTFTYSYIIVGLMTTFIYNAEWIIHKKYKIILRKCLSLFIIFLAPHFLFLIYLLITSSLKDYLFQAIQFNTKYYIYNYPRTSDSSMINPIRFAIVITYDFFLNFHTLFMGVLQFGFSYPMNMTMAVGNVVIFFYFLFKRKYILASFVLLMLIFANARSSVLASKETDYQAAVYIFISFLNIFFILPELYKNLQGNTEYMGKVLFSGLFIILSIYFFFCTFFLIRKFSDKYYPKYMGKAPLIYNRPVIAPIINSLVSKDEFSWIGPFSFEELYYMNAQTPSKYQILIPGMGKSQKVQDEMITEFESNKPTVIYFQRSFNVLGSPVAEYGKFFSNYLDRNFTTVLQYKQTHPGYSTLIPIDDKVDIDANLYLRKDKADTLIKKLIDNGYIKGDK